MRRLRMLTLGATTLLSLSTIASAQEPYAPGPSQGPAPASILDRSSDRAYEVVAPRLGQGYVGYELPAVDCCPCGSDRCFHPGRYYYGGKPYVSAWRKRWLGAHFGHGSMLDCYGAHCLSPGLTRPYWRPVSLEELNSAPTPAGGAPPDAQARDSTR